MTSSTCKLNEVNVGARSQLKQISDRGSRAWTDVAPVLDAGFLANVGFVDDGQPFVIPMVYERSDQSLFLHGAAGSRLIRALQSGAQICISVTLVDGIVLAKSAFNHSMNYRSAVVFGRGQAVTVARDKIAALRIISDHLIEGRWNDVRGPNRTELGRTGVIRIEIEEASAKVRKGPPTDDPADHRIPTWTGVLPFALRLGQPVPDPHASDRVPSYLSTSERFDACSE